MVLDPGTATGRPKWRRPPTPAGLRRVLAPLRGLGCALSHLDLADPRPDLIPGSTVTADALEVLAVQDSYHAAVQSRLPRDAFVDLMEVAHVVDWQEILAGYDWSAPADDPPSADAERHFRSVAAAEFHRWVNFVILCAPCHRLYDKRHIPRELVWRARKAVLSTEVGAETLRTFIMTSLAMRGVQTLTGLTVDEVPQAAVALYELKELHEVTGIVPVDPWRRNRRFTRSYVDLTNGVIGVVSTEEWGHDDPPGPADTDRTPGDDPNDAHLVYRIEAGDPLLHPWRQRNSEL